MDHLRRLVDNRISIPIKPDEDGFTGRECPQPDCEGYFKVQFGTGLEGEGLPCHCPYCGHTAMHDHYWTRDQIEYLRSVAMQTFTDAVRKDLKKMEFKQKSKSPLGIELSLTFKPGNPVPIRHYREEQLETEVICAVCTLRYSVYGVFAILPRLQANTILSKILEKNIELVAKVMDLAEGTGNGHFERTHREWAGGLRVGLRWVRARIVPGLCEGGDRTVPSWRESASRTLQGLERNLQRRFWHRLVF